MCLFLKGKVGNVQGCAEIPALEKPGLEDHYKVKPSKRTDGRKEGKR